MEHVAGLQHLDDRAAGLIGPLGLEDRLVKIMVERLAFRIDAADTVTLEDTQELALGGRDPGEEAARSFVLDLRFRQALERPSEIVGGRALLRFRLDGCPSEAVKVVVGGIFRSWNLLLFLCRIVHDLSYPMRRPI